jgi:hypothetical protein
VAVRTAASRCGALSSAACARPRRVASARAVGFTLCTPSARVVVFAAFASAVLLAFFAPAAWLPAFPAFGVLAAVVLLALFVPVRRTLTS